MLRANSGLVKGINKLPASVADDTETKKDEYKEMVDIEIFRQFALSFADTNEQPHFEATSFRVNGKIFASLEIDKQKACLKFSIDDQQQFCSFDKAIYPVDNHWGKSGWTYIDITKICEDLLVDALTSAYKEVLNSKNKMKK